MEKRPSIIILACLVISAVSVLFILSSRGQQPKEISYAPPLAKADPSRESTVASSDGKRTLKMKEEKGKEGVTYTFWVINSADNSQKEVFRKNVPLNTTFAIPANTFSPDGKYVFLKETAPEGTSYPVLSALGTPLTKDGSTLEIVGLFAGKYPNYKITDVTGWGGVGLIVFNTDKSEGGIGPSFWFEIPSGGFIQLSTRFN